MGFRRLRVNVMNTAFMNSVANRFYIASFAFGKYQLNDTDPVD